MDRSTGSRGAGGPLLAVGSAAGAGIAAETLLSLLRGPAPSVDYLLLCAGLTLAAALLVAAPFALLLPRVAPALGAWVAFCTFAVLADEGLVRAGLLGAGAGLLAGVALRLGPDRTPSRAGLAIAAATFFLVVLLPRLPSRIGLDPDGIAWGLLSFLAVGLLLAAHAGYAAWRSRPRGLPSDAWVSALLLAGMIAPVAVDARLFDRAPPPPAASADRGAPEADLPTVVVLILDTVRADHLSIYGYERDTTPELRRFLEESDRAVLYPWAFSPASWTFPAHASLFSGQLPSTHGAHALTKFRKPYPKIEGSTLAEVFRERGYRTAALFANAILSGHPSLRRGFDLYRNPPRTVPLELVGEGIRRELFPWLLAEAVKPNPPAAIINRGVLDFLEGCDGAPCLVVANYMEAHGPYAPAPPHAGLFSDDLPGPPRTRTSWSFSEEANRMAEARYDEEIHALDAALGRLLDELGRRGILDRAWLVITADHGEAFGEHELHAHGTSVYNDQVRIPLLVQPPRGERLVPRDDAVGLLDVTATLTAVAGEPPLGLGRDLRAAAPERPVQIEFFGNPPDTPPAMVRDLGPRSTTAQRAVVMGTTKVIESPEGRELYRLAEDPAERVDRAREAEAEAARLAERLPPLEFTPLEGDEDRKRLSHDEREQLRALGYLD